MFLQVIKPILTNITIWIVMITIMYLVQFQGSTDADIALWPEKVADW